MAEASQDQDKSEEATPYKLSKAREKGSVARGVDLGFFAALFALAGFLSVAGEAMAGQLAQMMRRTLATGIASAGDPQLAIAAVRTAYWPALYPVILLGGTILALVILLELIQLRGFVFSAHPLKPDFSRINPGKGLKRVFSMRTLKEALKSVVKMTIYAGITYLLIAAAIRNAGPAIGDASALAGAMRQSGMRMLWVFAGLAFFFAVLDQILTRGEFRKQMRMSRRDVTREGKEREGDPRLKRKRKQLHAEFVQRSAGLGALPGSDMLVVNPEHVAVALAYDREAGRAPVVSAKARNRHALLMKRQAMRLGIPIFASPALARALYADYDTGREIGPDHYHDVATLYFRLGTSSGEPAAGDMP